MSTPATTSYRYTCDDHRLAVEQALRDPHGPRLGAFAENHRYLADAAYIDLYGTSYQSLRSDGRPTDAWYKTVDGVWVDITPREQLRWDIGQRTEEVRRAEQRELIAQARALREAKLQGGDQE